MSVVITALPALTISALYCFWNVYQQHQLQRQRRLRERVTYMLWVMATKNQQV